MSASPVIADDVLTRAVDGVGLDTVFQPVVDLAIRTVVGYEALSRWPGRGLTPDTVFAAARERRRTGHLDRLCRTSAVAAARHAGLDSTVTLLVNVEPGTLDLEHDHDLLSTGGTSTPRTVLEFTERDLLHHPATLLTQAALAREQGHGIALDDVGAHPDSLALLDLLLPDIVKLDLELVQRAPARDRTRTLAAVMAHAERTGAVVLAEGIETDEHLARALACGATLGQGWLFGRPRPLGPGAERRHQRLRLGHSPAPVPTTPVELLDAGGVRVADKALLVAFSRHIEAQGDNPADPAVVVAALQSVEHITDRTRHVYAGLARRSPFVALLGLDVPDVPAPGVRGAHLDATDPLCREWTVAALGAQTAAALIARDRGDQLPDLQRRFDFVVTYDRDLVTKTMRSLMSRVL